MTNVKRRISAVLAAKLVTKSADRQRYRERFHGFISAHSGNEAGGGGDSFLAEFASVHAALECAQEMQAHFAEPDRSDRRASTEHIRIGVALGEVQEDEGTIYGDAVQTAGQMRELAAAGRIVVSGSVREQLLGNRELDFRQLQTTGTARATAYLATAGNSGRSGFEFVQELIRRRVFRAAGAYAIASWLLVQVASIVFPEFDAPGWAMRTLILMLIVGFPLAMLLAWTVDFTSSGFVLTPDSPYTKVKGRVARIGIVGAASVISAAVLWWVWVDYIEPTTQRPARATIKSEPVVAVNVPRKLSGGDDIDWLGQGVANLIRNELAESSHVIIFSQARWNTISESASSADQLVSLAKDAGVDYLIDGEYLRTPDGIVLTTRIEDLENGIEIQGARIEHANSAGIIAASTEIAVRTKSALKIPLRENVKRFAADFAVQNMEAYEVFIAGLGYLVNFDYQQAEESFEAALAVAPDFHMARFRLAEVLEATGRTDLARRELDQIPDNAPLTERERYYVNGAKSSFIAQRDAGRSIEIYQQLVRDYPYDMEGGQHLADAYWIDFQEDAAIDEYRRLAELHSYHPSAWMALGERLLDVGRLEEASDVLQRYADMAPGDPYAVALLGNLAQLDADFALSEEYYEKSLALKPGFAIATLGLARSRYLGGDFVGAESMWRSLIGNGDEAARFRIDAAFDLAGVLRGQGKFEKSMEPLLQIESTIRAAGLRTAMMLSTLGLAHLESGETAEATSLIDQAIQERPTVATRYLFARGLLEIHENRFTQLQNTVAEIRALALPAEDPDRTEDKAASYLLGMAALRQDDLALAGRELAIAVGASGYEYALYATGLARYLARAGELNEALRIAVETESARDPGDLRLDLELDRARALLLRAEILAAMDAADESRKVAQRFIDRWHSASDRSLDLRHARALLAQE